MGECPTQLTLHRYHRKVQDSHLSQRDDLDDQKHGSASSCPFLHYFLGSLGMHAALISITVRSS